MTADIRVAVIDDHQLFREGIIELLATLPHIEVVAQGGTAREAVTIAAAQQPNVMLLDLDMPDASARERGSAGHTTQRVLDESPETRVLILTMHDDAKLVRELVRAGASGYMPKTVGREELLAAVRTAASDRNTVTVSLSRTEALALSAREPSKNELLTKRELEVLTLVADGGSNRDIARELHITEATVKRHLATTFTKLGATSRISAVNAASRLGLLIPDGA